LEKYSIEDLPNAGQILLDYYTKRSAKRLKDQTSLASVDLFAKPLSSLPKGFDPTKNVTAQNSQESGQMMAQLNQSEEVDRCAETVEVEEEKKMGYTEEEVDRFAETKDFPNSNTTIGTQSMQTGHVTLGRAADTVDLDEKENVETSQGQKNNPLEVARSSSAKDPEDRENDKTDGQQEVNRSAETEDLPENVEKWKTIDDYALLVGTSEMSQLHSGVITQSLEGEAVSLPSQTYQIPLEDVDEQAVISQEQGNKARGIF